MKETIKETIIVTVVLLFLLAALVLFCSIPAYTQVDTQYTRSICVDKSEKIEQALSNAVEDVTSRKFIVVSTSVKKRRIDDSFVVEVKGIDRGSLLSLGK